MFSISYDIMRPFLNCNPASAGPCVPRPFAAASPGLTGGVFWFIILSRKPKKCKYQIRSLTDFAGGMGAPVSLPPFSPPG